MPSFNYKGFIRGQQFFDTTSIFRINFTNFSQVKTMNRKLSSTSLKGMFLINCLIQRHVF